MECMRRFSQVVLIIINIFVVLLGLATMAIGIWLKVNDKVYFQVASNETISQLSILLIIVGLFIMIVGAVGAVGAIFASTIFGRITLGLYSVVLSLLVICEIAAGIAAAVKRGDLENLFRDGANNTFTDVYNGTGDWNNFERELRCCGVSSYMDYRNIIGVPVPVSCCVQDTSECRTILANPTPDQAEQYLFQQGCADAVISGVSHNLGAVAGGAIVLGLFQIAGIVMACFVAIYRRDDNKYEVV